LFHSLQFVELHLEQQPGGAFLMGCGAPVHPLLIMKSTAKPQRVCARAGHVQQGSFNTRNLWVAGTNNGTKVLGTAQGRNYDPILSARQQPEWLLRLSLLQETGGKESHLVMDLLHPKSIV
jgi:hypothetical protein